MNLFHRKSGAGPLVLLLHGFTESGEIWKTIQDKLSEEFSVIAPDLPGHGKSPAAGGEMPVERMAELAERILPKSGDVVVIGHSMGGYVALAFAEMFPERLAGLGLVHSTCFPDSEEKKQDRLRAIQVVKENKSGFLNGLIPNLFTPANRVAMQAEIREAKRIAGEASAEGLVAALMAMHDRPDRSDVLRHCEAPVLILAGKEDAIIPEPVFNEMISMPGLSRHQLLQHSGHMGFMEEPELTAFAIQSFVRFCYGIE